MLPVSSVVAGIVRSLLALSFCLPHPALQGSFSEEFAAQSLLSRGSQLASVEQTLRVNRQSSYHLLYHILLARSAAKCEFTNDSSVHHSALSL